MSFVSDEKGGSHARNMRRSNRNAGMLGRREAGNVRVDGEDDDGMDMTTLIVLTLVRSYVTASQDTRNQRETRQNVQLLHR